MKKSSILAIALGTAVISTAAYAASGGDADPQSPAQTGTWLSIPAVYEKVAAAGYRDINEIEREKGGYEVKAVNAGGERVKLYVDPRNGEVLDVRVKRDKRTWRNQWKGPQAERFDGRRGRDGDYRYDRADR